MSVDIYNSAVLNRVVQDLKDTAKPQFLLDRYFSEASTSEQEEIYFDQLTGKPRLAPFCSPYVEGQIVQSKGYTTKSFKPAYVKDKRVFEDAKPVKRPPGAPISGPLSPAQIRNINLANESKDQIDMLQRRLEWMAWQELLTGAVVVSGEKYQTTNVDFGRDGSLTVSLTSSARWSQNTATPLDDLETWSGLIRTASGARATDVIMPQNVWGYFRSFDSVKEQMRQDKGLSPRTKMDIGPDSLPLGVTYKGRCGDFDIFIHTDQYQDENGATQKFLPNDKLIMTGPELEGVRHFGAIKDEDAGFQALDFFSKSWKEPDPSVRFLMLASAPLPVPYRINASLCATVHV